MNAQENDLKVENKYNNNTEILFIPSILYEKTQEELKDILNDSLLLDAILNTTHPEVLQQMNILKEAYKTNIRFSEELLNQKSSFLNLQKNVENTLNELKKYEKRWEDVKKEMEISFKFHSKPYLLTRLDNAIKETDDFSNSLQKSFLEDKENNDVLEFIKKYRQARKLYYFRLEKKEHWESGKIIGL
ncbi:uncharacterized protein T551_03088 [Pneumocystis jirovecii RU7]|uniref:VPS37 C-terminal domain-containing protein n=1 Tax=Pneumocystis jirovecii (strain RU7) TaxID=1408657 RepID=A0A0W4ZGV3_PNEJ7|nr:uncharacterized protein T551_03088 [Pneumocystis jirovecii RU7]KTW27589.1 hypothetical protein T551_03088 [Pneumocystis jirovecii RU7]